MDTQSVGSSGMNAVAKGVQVTANNIANLRSEEPQARRPDQSELPGGARPTQVQTPQEQTPPRDSNVRMTREADREAARETTSREADREAANREAVRARDESAYTANAAIRNAGSQVMGTVVDLKA